MPFVKVAPCDPEEKMTLHRTKSVCIAVLLLVCGTAVADWPGFRGPQGTGNSPETGLPVHWSEKENVVWKTPLPGPGSSSPIVWGDRVFVTCYSGYGDGKTQPSDMEQLRRYLLCLDRLTGKVLWQVEVPAKQPEVKWNSPVHEHGYSTSTPVTDGERVYVFFGRTGVFAYDFTGKQLWQADVGDMRNMHGSGASLVLYRNLLLVNAAVESGRLVALAKDSGKVVWRVRLQDDCWTTPLLVDTADGKPDCVLMTPGTILGLDPETGQERWQCECPEPDYVSANPVARNGIVYVMGAGKQGRVFLAVRTGGKGDVTQTHVLWKQKVGASYCSPVLAGDYLYFFSGQAHCLRADTGEIVFQQRLADVGPEYSSPVVADGRIYLFTRRGTGLVLAVGGHLQVLAKNSLGDQAGFTTSPAVCRGQIFIRSNEYLYCLGDRTRTTP
jgi:outer membrane protein assembly factor BamB